MSCRIISLLIMLMTVTIGISASKTEKEIITRTAENGTIVFVKPRQIPPLPNSESKKNMEFDITIMTSSDSVSVTATIIAPKEVNADSVTINGYLHFPYERIYCEPKRNNWVSRVRFAMPVGQFESTFCSPTEPLRIEYGASGFGLDTKKQKRYSETNLTALKIIELNR